MSLGERFWSKVDKSAQNGCWDWTAATGLGYGRYATGAKRGNTWVTRLAHRLAYEELVGPIPEGLVLDHLCENPGCVNPDHLEPVMIGVNTLRGSNQTAQNAVATHCRAGHAFTRENTLRYANKRQCRECGRQRQREYNARLRMKAAA